VRLLLVGDLHYTMRQFDWVVDQAERFDLVVLAGDHLDIGSPVPLEAQVPVVMSYLQRLAERTTVVASSGNHDLTTRDSNDEKAASWILAARASGVVTDWDSIDVDGLRITVSPWWDGPAGREAVDRLLRDAAPEDGRTWVWVYHGPPAGLSSWGGHRSFGDPDLTEWIRSLRPSVVLSGHVHQAPFVPDGSWHDVVDGTHVFNAGHLPGDRPAHVVLELSDHSAWWWSYDGEGEIELGESGPGDLASRPGDTAAPVQ
jgi:Icc-related predicted phosphoesterase